MGFKKTMIAVWTCVLAILLPLLVSCSSGEERQTELLSVKIKNDEKTVEVKATLDDGFLSEHAGEKLYLLALDSAYTSSLSDYSVVGESKGRGKMTFRFDLEDDDGKSLIASAFVLARKTSGEGDYSSYSAITQPTYIENPELLASTAKRAPDVVGIKGLSTNDVYEAELLGAEHISFLVEMDKLLLPEYAEGSIRYNFGGRSYYFDVESVSRLDKQVSEASALGLRVYLRTVLKYPQRDPYGEYETEPIESLYFSNTASGKSGYLPNMENSVGAGYVRAFYDFLGSRYNGKNGEHGCALDYIIGDSVNSHAQNCNAGNMPSERVLANYLSWARTADNILRSYNKNAQIYVPVDNALRVEDTDKRIGSKVFLSQLAALSGDWGFAVAMSLGEGEDLGDVLAGTSGDISLVGVNSLTSFTDFLRQEELLYHSKSRRVIIDGLLLPDSLTQVNRAAYYTYAYYKASEAGFDSFFYTNACNEGTLCGEGSTRADLYYAFLMCGSDLNAQLHDYTDKLPNASLPDFKAYVSRELTYEQTVETEVGRAVVKNKKVFPVKLKDFYPAGSVFNAALGNVSSGAEEGLPSLTVYQSPEDGHGAISVVDISASEMIESGYVGITMSAKIPSTVALILSDRSEEMLATYMGEARVSAEQKTYYFNIRPFTEHIKPSHSLKMSICLLPNAENEEVVELTVTDLALYGTSGNGSGTILSIVFVAIGTLAICALLFWLTQRRKRSFDRYQDEE